jgi:hypothetical protein
MKKIIILVMLLFFSVSIYSQIRDRRAGNGLYNAYEDRPNGYIVIKETELLDMATGMPLQGRTLLPGTVFSRHI